MHYLIIVMLALVNADVIDKDECIVNGVINPFIYFDIENNNCCNRFYDFMKKQTGTTECSAVFNDNYYYNKTNSDVTSPFDYPQWEILTKYCYSCNIHFLCLTINDPMNQNPTYWTFIEFMELITGICLAFVGCFILTHKNLQKN